MLKPGKSSLLQSARQRGAMTILTIFIVLMSLGALGVLGLGQVVWEREEVQRIADLAAKAAASDISNASTTNFQAARDYAERNGLNPPEDTIDIDCNVKGTDTPLPPENCQLSVLVRVTRTVPAAFLGSEPVSAVAEATVVPFVSGIVGTNLLSANFNGGALSPLLNQIGVKLGLDVGGFSDLLASDLQVDLQQLSQRLVVGGEGALDLAALLNEEVSAQELLTEAAEIAGLPDAGLGNMNDPAMNEEFTLGDIISADQAIEANLPVASVRLGNLAFAAVLSAATLLPENSIKVDLGNTVRATVGQPPQLFVAVKRRADNEIIATAQTEKITLSTKINGVLDLEVSAGGGEVRVRDIECRLPQSDSAVVADLRSSVVEASLDLPGLPSVLGDLEVVLIPGQDPPAIPAALSVESASNQRFEGFPDPVLEGRYSFEASQGLPDLLDQLNVELDILGDLLNVLEVNSPVNTALGLLGSQLDSLLNLLGLGVNEVVVRVDNMDCFNTAVLTR